MNENDYGLLPLAAVIFLVIIMHWKIVPKLILQIVIFAILLQRRACGEVR